MLAGTRHHTRARRGIVLVLVLAMLGLLALIGVTFATFSGQARINAHNFTQSVIQPQDDELMDFALQQLITDTGDLRSAIRGHSLARDMFGNDANNNGYLAANPLTGSALLIQNIAPSTDHGRCLRRADEYPDPGASSRRCTATTSPAGSCGSRTPARSAPTTPRILPPSTPGRSARRARS